MRYEEDYSNRNYDRYNDRNRSYGNSYNRDRDRDRGFFDKSGDEVRSWFGDDRAERRRDMDEMRNRDDVRNWGDHDRSDRDRDYRSFNSDQSYGRTHRRYNDYDRY